MHDDTPVTINNKAPRLSKDQARQLTDDIRYHVEAAYVLLLQAHEQRAWEALGYQSWAAYVEAEFPFSQRRAYQLLDQGRVIRELTQVCTSVHTIYVTEAAARELKPELPTVLLRVRQALASSPSDAGPAQVVNGVVVEYREELEERRTAEREEQEDRERERERRQRRAARRPGDRMTNFRGAFEWALRRLEEVPDAYRDRAVLWMRERVMQIPLSSELDAEEEDALE